MAQYEVLDYLDYRPKGDTVDDFAVKYKREIGKIYSHLNALKGSRLDDEYLTAPEPGQILVRDGFLQIRDEANENWVIIGRVEYLMGFLPSLDNRVLTTADIDDGSYAAGKITAFGEDGRLNASITGSPGKISGIAIDTEFAPGDGTVLVYRAGENKFFYEDKLTGSEYEELLAQQRAALDDFHASIETNATIHSEVMAARDTATAASDSAAASHEATSVLADGVDRAYFDIKTIRAAVLALQTGAAESATAAAESAGEAATAATLAVSYVACQPWDAERTYQPGEVAMAADGTAYRAIAETTGEEPPAAAWAVIDKTHIAVDENGDLMPFV